MNFIKSTLNQVDLTGDTLYDFIYDLFFYAKIKESEEDIENGRVMTIEESKERMRKKYANFNVQ